MKKNAVEKSIMLKDVVKADPKSKAMGGKNNPKNEFLSILEKSQKEDKQKKAKEPVRHNFEEFQEIVKS